MKAEDEAEALQSRALISPNSPIMLCTYIQNCKFMGYWIWLIDF